MKQEWKPGDVAMVRRNGKEVVAMRYHTGAEGGWQQAAGLAFDHFDADPQTTPRPLVVIDPEDREQVERLIRAWVGATAGCPDALRVTEQQVDRLQAALREFANPTPPKPEEPTGLGAVVEDETGYHWVRGKSESHLTWFDPTSEYDNRHWGQIAAVRVLSEGVPA